MLIRHNSSLSQSFQVGLRRFGQILRDARNDQKMTLEELGKKLGITKAHMSEIELGKCKCADYHVPVLARELKKDEQWLAQQLLKHTQPMMFKMLFGLPTNDADFDKLYELTLADIATSIERR